MCTLVCLESFVPESIMSKPKIDMDHPAMAAAFKAALGRAEKGAGATDPDFKMTKEVCG